MKVKSTIQLNTSAIRKLVEAAKEAQKDTTYGIADDVTASQVVPYRTGKLEFTADVDYSDVEDGHTAITFNTPYARRIYFNPDGWKIHQDYNTNAQSMWLQVYIDGEKSDMPKELFVEAWKRYSEGVIK